MDDLIILAAANSYEELYYFNEDFENVPKGIQDEIKIVCVTFTEKNGGIFVLAFDKGGTLVLETSATEEDITYDEIGAHLKIKELQMSHKELWESLEAYYRAFY